MEVGTFAAKKMTTTTKIMIAILNALWCGSLESIIGIMPSKTLMASARVPLGESFDMVGY
jgi:hypothetical protein